MFLPFVPVTLVSKSVKFALHLLPALKIFYKPHLEGRNTATLQWSYEHIEWWGRKEVTEVTKK